MTNEKNDDLGVKLHSTMDAVVWAAEFKRINPNSDEDLMRSWFANALMAAHDIVHQKLDPKIEKLKQLLVLTDPAVSSEEMNELSAKQWAEFIKCFPDET